MASTTIYNANLAASTTTANILAGDTIEFTPSNSVSLVNVYQVSSAIGIKVTAMAGSSVDVQDKEIPFIGTTLVKKDHLVTSFLAAPGSRLSIFLKETAAAATTDVYTTVEVIPV